METRKKDRNTEKNASKGSNRNTEGRMKSNDKEILHLIEEARALGKDNERLCKRTLADRPMKQHVKLQVKEIRNNIRQYERSKNEIKMRNLEL